MTPIVSLIAAVSENCVLGAANKLVWHMPTDFEYYKSKVRYKPIIMGRKTFESEDMFFSEKQNIIITRDKSFTRKDFDVAHSLKDAVDLVNGDEVFVVGGAQIYNMALPIADVLYLTLIHTEVKGDAFFPKLIPQEWELKWEEFHQADQKNPYDYTFRRYEHRKHRL